MSLCNEGTDTTMLVTPAGYNAGGNCGNGMWGQDSWWFIIILALLFWNNGGWGNNGNNGGGMNYIQPALTRGELCQDMNFSDLESGVRGVQQGLCDGFYAMNTGMLNGFAGINQNLSNGFANLNTNLCQLGNNVAQGQNGIQMSIMNGTNSIQSQLAECCCGLNRSIDGINYNGAINTANIQNAIQANTTQGVMNTNALSTQIQQCCCSTEKDFMQSRFDASQNTCATLQAIDKVGDRIIDYLNCEKTQALRDELQTARLAASQAAQTDVIISRLNPTPIPAYPACSYGGYNPNFLSYNQNNGCGCGCGCN